MTRQTDLIDFLFDQRPHRLSGVLLEWLEASSRFTAFAETYRDKIRKKIRLTSHDPETSLDLCGELEVAYCLLNDRRLVIAYEPYASDKARSPDYAVTYRTNLTFNLEVARLRWEASPADSSPLLRRDDRLLRILLDKLGQLRGSMPNLLLVQTTEDVERSIDLNNFMQSIKTRADGKDPSFYTINRYTTPAAFYRDFVRLSAILLCSSASQLWINKQSRSPLPEKVLRLVRELLSAPS